MEFNDVRATANPFQSPLASVDPSIRLPQQGYWENQRGRGPVTMLFIGAIVGCAAAAVTAAVGAVIFSLTVEFLRFGPGLELALSAAFVSSVMGACGGMPVGAILGIVAGFNKPRVQRLLKLFAAGCFALIVASIGLSGSLMLAEISAKFRASANFTINTGVICGFVTGAAGGWYFAHLLGNICWGRPPTKTQVQESFSKEHLEAFATREADGELEANLSHTMKRFSVNIESLNSGLVLKTHLRRGNQPLTYSEVLDLWQNDTEFRSYFNNLLAECPFAAFRWETPPITANTLNRPFEFVLLDCPALVGRADATSFADHLSAAKPTDEVVAFANLGRDAFLVVPCLRGAPSAYGHLAAFTREAPAAQQHALWQTVASEVLAHVSQQPIWLSTAGLGVPWLHLRIDTRSKYYGYSPYRSV